MLDKSIDGALLALRKKMMRGDGHGLHHVEALLAMRGVPMPRVLPHKRSDVARKGQVRRAILAALNGGPKTRRDIAVLVYGDDRRKSCDLASQALHKLKADGIIAHEGRKWLMPRAASNPSSHD